MKITSGRKIAYVVDCGFSDANQQKILAYPVVTRTH